MKLGWGQPWTHQIDEGETIEIVSDSEPSKAIDEPMSPLNLPQQTTRAPTTAEINSGTVPESSSEMDSESS